MNIKSRLLPLVAALAAIVSVPSAMASTATGTMLVSITLTNACTIAAADVPFGSTTTLAANIDVSANVGISCTGANPVSISFDAGTGTGSTTAARHMNNGTNIVNYNLYRDSARSVILGVTAGTDTIDFTSTGSGTTDTKVVYGRVPAQAAKPNGLYTSNVVATLTY